MAIDTITKTTIPGLFVIRRPIIRDNRGGFHEVVRIPELNQVLDEPFSVVQTNMSITNEGGLRGLHAESWRKIITPVSGTAFAAIADLRPTSPTFGKVETFNFSDDQDPYSLFLSVGLANSICAVKGVLRYVYEVDSEYRPDSRAVAWNDPDLNIAWPISNPVLSERDSHNPSLRQLFPEMF